MSIKCMNETWVFKETVCAEDLYQSQTWHKGLLEEEIFLYPSSQRINWHETDSVQFGHSIVSDSLQPHERQHDRPPCPSPTPRVHPNSCPSSQWCHPTILFSVVPFSSCPQSFPASGSWQMSQLFTSGSQSIGVSVSTSVLQMSMQDWFPLGWTGLISWLSKGPSKVFSNTTIPNKKRWWENI